jgi:hypothetical protein
MKNRTLRSTLLVTAGFILFGAATAQAEPYCREYTKNVQIGNRTEQSYGTACQQPDGSWRIQSADDRQSVGSTLPEEQIVENDVTYTPPPTVIVQDPGYYYYSGPPYRQQAYYYPYYRGYYHGYYGHGGYYGGHRGGHRGGGGHGAVSFSW